MCCSVCDVSIRLVVYLATPLVCFCSTCSQGQPRHHCKLSTMKGYCPLKQFQDPHRALKVLKSLEFYKVVLKSLEFNCGQQNILLTQLL